MGKGIRPVEPGGDDHVINGGLKKPILDASGLQKLLSCEEVEMGARIGDPIEQVTICATYDPSSSGFEDH